jgi:hypothetical protein
MAAQDTVKRLVLAPAKKARQALFPEYGALIADVPEAYRLIAEAHAAIDRIHQRLDALEARAATLEAGLHEERRLNLRIAELTDLVTEVVLPLHDREIDATKFGSLAPDTL